MANKYPYWVQHERWRGTDRFRSKVTDDIPTKREAVRQFKAATKAKGTTAVFLFKAAPDKTVIVMSYRADNFKGGVFADNATVPPCPGRPQANKKGTTARL